MNELGNFFIQFTTNGLTALKDGLRDLDKHMDDLNKKMTNSGSSSDKFFNGMGSWLGKITALAAGIVSLGKAIKDTFDIGDKIVNLNLLADAAGATAEEVEALSIATQPYGGSIQSAANFYRTMANLQTEMGRGQYGEAMREELSRAGFFISPMASTEEYMRALSSALTSYTNAGKFGDRDKLAKAFGLDDSMMLFLSGGQENVDKMLAYGRQHSVLSGRNNLEAAQEMRKALNELKEIWNRLLVQMMPILTQILEILKPILECLAPIAEWALKQVGGVLNAGKQFVDLLTGKQNMQEFTDTMVKQDNIFGRAARFGARMGEEYAGLASANKANREMRQLIEKFNSGTANWGELIKLKTLMKENGIFEGEEAKILDTAIQRMKPTYNPLNSKSISNTSNNSATVNATINITGMGEDAAIKTGNAVQKQLNRLEFQPATVAGGVR